MHKLGGLVALAIISLASAQSDLTNGYDGYAYQGCWTDISPRALGNQLPIPYVAAATIALLSC